MCIEIIIKTRCTWHRASTRSDTRVVNTRKAWMVYKWAKADLQSLRLDDDDDTERGDRSERNQMCSCRSSSSRERESLPCLESFLFRWQSYPFRASQRFPARSRERRRGKRDRGSFILFEWIEDGSRFVASLSLSFCETGDRRKLGFWILKQNTSMTSELFLRVTSQNRSKFNPLLQAERIFGDTVRGEINSIVLLDDQSVFCRFSNCE